jgi:hypothetical protein
MLIYTTLYYISEGVENSTLSLFSSVTKIIIYNIIDIVKKLQDYVYLIKGGKRQCPLICEGHHASYYKDWC